MLKETGWVCALCGEPINPGLWNQHPWQITIDHIVPLSKGGAKGPSNWQPAHRRCNELKADSAEWPVPPPLARAGDL